MNKREQELAINQELKKADTILHEITSEMINNDQCINYYRAQRYDDEGRGYGPVLSRSTEITPYEDDLRDLEKGEFISTVRQLGKDVPLIRVEKRNDMNADGLYHLYNVVQYEKRKEILNCKTTASSVLKEHFFHEPYHAFDSQANVWIPRDDDKDPMVAVEFVSGKDPKEVTVEYVRVEIRNNIVRKLGTVADSKVIQYVTGIHILDADDNEVGVLTEDDVVNETIVKLDAPVTTTKFQFKFDVDPTAANDLVETTTDLTNMLRIEVANINLYEVIPYKITV